MASTTISAYARTIRPELAPDTFAPARSRLLWLPAHVGVIALASAAIAGRWLPVPSWGALSVLIGASFAGLTFLGHETLHGAVVRGRLLRRLVGWFGFLPFVVSPTLWVAWHNRVHHGHTNRPSVDPDAYPTLAEYNQSRALRMMTDKLAPGRRRLLGVMSLLLGFSVQSVHLLLAARSRGWLSPREHRRALLGSALGVGVWLAVAWAVGPLAFLFCYCLPLLLANTIVMAFILTNHSLSPHTQVNDPLANSLSVTLPRWAEWLTLGFGLHVEHHLFPAMSARHARRVRDVLRSRWADRYRWLPLGRALLALHRSPRVYKTDTMLLDPQSGAEWPLVDPQE